MYLNQQESGADSTVRSLFEAGVGSIVYLNWGPCLQVLPMTHSRSLLPALGQIVPIEEPKIVPTENGYLAVKRGHLSVDSNPGHPPGLVQAWKE